MYARGMSVREIPVIWRRIPRHRRLVARPDLGRHRRGPWKEVAEWQNRPLDACFPLVFFDAIRVKIREEGASCATRPLYIALGIPPADSTKEILGIWIEQTPAPNSGCARRLNELKTRGVGVYPDRRRRRIEGFSRSDQRRFSANGRQTCIVHLIRHSLEFRVWKDPQDGDPSAARNLPRQGRRRPA